MDFTRVIYSSLLSLPLSHAGRVSYLYLYPFLSLIIYFPNNLYSIVVVVYRVYTLLLWLPDDFPLFSFHPFSRPFRHSSFFPNASKPSQYTLSLSLSLSRFTDYSSVTPKLPLVQSFLALSNLSRNTHTHIHLSIVISATFVFLFPSFYESSNTRFYTSLLLPVSRQF